jgi:hypothetical protein
MINQTLERLKSRGEELVVMREEDLMGVIG